jgi:phosphate transport system ATP-binding protein
MVNVMTSQPGVSSGVSSDSSESRSANIVIETLNLSVYYGSFMAVRDATFSIARREITSFIGPSGCGKSTVIRSLNRMNDLVQNQFTTILRLALV